MVTKKTGKPPGRPKKDDVPFLQNPKRFAVMLVRANMVLMTQKPPSIRAASKFVAAWLYGNEVEHEGLPPAAPDIVARCPPGAITQVYAGRQIGTHGYINARPGSKAGTIKGAAEYLRQLDRRAHQEAKTNPDVARWLRCAVGGLVMAARGAAPDQVVAIFRNSGDPELEADGQRMFDQLPKVTIPPARVSLPTSGP